MPAKATKPAAKPAGKPAAKKAEITGKKNQGKQEIKALKTDRKAKKATKAIRPKTGVAKKRKIHTSVTFHRPKTLHIARKTRPGKSSVTQRKLDSFRIIRYPHTSEKAMKKIEDDNTLVFIVDIHANKKQIRAAMKKAYNIKPIRVNTLIRPDGKKKAFVKLSRTDDALDVANKIGIV